MKKGMTDSERRSDPQQIRVWDPFIRFFHWVVLLGFFVAYFTEDELLTLHVWAGYAVGALVLLRVFWGFVGPKHARFTDFVRGPVESYRYLVDLVQFRAKRYLGHSPAGGLMVLVLLGGLAATVWSGLELYALEENAGPLARLSESVSIQPVRADEDDRDTKKSDSDESDSSELWEEAHELLANLMLLLVIVHVAGVLLASLVHRENLARSMVSGWKRLK
jgi:cytochrome b